MPTFSLFAFLWHLQPKVVTIFQKIGQSKEVYDALKFLQVPACQRCVTAFRCRPHACQPSLEAPSPGTSCAADISRDRLSGLAFDGG